MENHADQRRLGTPCIVVISLVLVGPGCSTKEQREQEDKRPPASMKEYRRHKSPRTSPKEHREARSPRTSAPQSVPPSITLDGIATDWSGVRPFLEEVGMKGASKSTGAIDIQKVYLANNAENLYIFICCVPPVVDRFKTPTIPPKRFLQVFIDTDNDPNTGCLRQLMFVHEPIDGYDVMVSLEAPFEWDSEQTYVAYRLRRPDDEGKLFRFSPEIKGGYQTSQALNKRVAHGRDGVELMIPITLLKARRGRKMRLLFLENPHVDEHAYSLGTYTLK